MIRTDDYGPDTARLPTWRSLLFCPADSERFLAKAHIRGADAIILDLEDSVPLGEKDAARAAVRTSVLQLAAAAGTTGVWVRPNAWESRLAGADLEAVVVAGLDGIFLPKVYGAALRPASYGDQPLRLE